MRPACFGRVRSLAGSFQFAAYREQLATLGEQLGRNAMVGVDGDGFSGHWIYHGMSSSIGSGAGCCWPGSARRIGG